MGSSASKVAKELTPRIDSLEDENKQLKSQLKNLQRAVDKMDLTDRVEALEIEKLETKAELEHILEIVKSLQVTVAELESRKEEEKSLAEEKNDTAEKVDTNQEKEEIAEEKEDTPEEKKETPEEKREVAVEEGNDESPEARLLFGGERVPKETDEDEPQPQPLTISGGEADKSGWEEKYEKSMIILDVKPWDDETDMEEMEAGVRAIQKDGLQWGAATLAEVIHGLKKLQITCVIENNKIDCEQLCSEIEELEDYVQLVDVASAKPYKE